MKQTITQGMRIQRRGSSADNKTRKRIRRGADPQQLYSKAHVKFQELVRRNEKTRSIKHVQMIQRIKDRELGSLSLYQEVAKMGQALKGGRAPAVLGAFKTHSGAVNAVCENEVVEVLYKTFHHLLYRLRLIFNIQNHCNRNFQTL